MFKFLKDKLKGLTNEETTLTEDDSVSLKGVFNILELNKVDFSDDIQFKVRGIKSRRSIMKTINQEFIYLLDKFGEVIATVIIDYNKNDIVCMEI